MNQNKEKKKILDAIISTINETKTHGVSNIIKSNSKILKLIWVTAFVLCVTYCIFQTVKTVVAYFSYGVVQNSFLVYECPAKFPAVTLCNLNPYDANVAKKYIDTILNENKVENYTTKKAVDQVEKINLIIKANLDQMAKNGNFNQWWNGFLLEQMLISCKYHETDCNVNDFYYIHDYDYGNCYRFNFGFVNNATFNESIKEQPIKISTKPGPENGLKLELYIGNTKLQHEYNYKSGVRIVVHNQSEIPLASLDGIDVPTGQSTNIAISRTFINHLPAPYSSNCIEVSKVDWNQNDLLFFMNNTYEFGVYTQKYCLHVCLQKYLILKCNCYNLKFPVKNTTNFTSCTSIKDINCLSNQTEQFNSFNKNENICYSKCPLECKKVTYNLKANQATYPSEWYSKYLLNNSEFSNMINNELDSDGNHLPLPTLDILPKTILMINLYYDEMFYTYITETPIINFDIMLACVGGNMGLFLGCSVLFFVEIIEILFHIVYISLNDYFIKNNKL